MTTLYDRIIGEESWRGLNLRWNEVTVRLLVWLCLGRMSVGDGVKGCHVFVLGGIRGRLCLLEC